MPTTNNVLNQQSLFDQAQTRRDAGIAQSRETSGEDWHRYALQVIWSHLKLYDTLHADELWKAGLRPPSSPRALGAVMQEAVKRGWMEKITTPEGWIAAKPSVRSNMQLKPVWRSLL